MTALGSAPARPTPELVRRVEDCLGRRGVHWHKPHTGLSPAQRFVVKLEDGASVFVKAAVDDRTERGLRTDHETSSPKWLLAVFQRMARDHLRWAARCLELPAL